MTNNNDFRQDNTFEDNSLDSNQNSDMLSAARERVAELRTSLLEQKNESKAKVQHAKTLLHEAKTMDKARKSKEKQLDSAVKKEINASAKADKALNKSKSIYDKRSLKRQFLESITLTEAIKQEDIEQSLEALNVQEEVLHQEIELTNNLLTNKNELVDAKTLEIDLKNSKYARAVLSDAYAEADRLNYRRKDEAALKKIKFSNVLSELDYDSVMEIEEERQRLIDEAEAAYVEQYDEIMALSDEEVPKSMRKKLIQEADAKLKEEIAIADGIAEVLLTDLALDKLATARQAVSGDLLANKSVFLAKISAIAEEERFRIVAERKEVLARIQKEKDDGVKDIINDASILEENKEKMIREFIKNKQLEAKEIIRQYNYEEKVRILASKAEIKIAFKQLATMQEDIAKVKYNAIRDNDSELESLDLLINETALRAEMLTEELEALNREREEKDKQAIHAASGAIQDKLDEIDNVNDSLEQFNKGYVKDANANIDKIKSSTDIQHLQDKLDAAKRSVLKEKQEYLNNVREQQVLRAMDKGQITEIRELQPHPLLEYDEEQDVAERTAEVIVQPNEQTNVNTYNENNERVVESIELKQEEQIEDTTPKLKAEDFLGDLLSLEDLAELELLEAELALLEDEKQKELQHLEKELHSLEESHEQEIEGLKLQSQELEMAKLNDLSKLEAEVAALEDEKRKRLAELDSG